MAWICQSSTFLSGSKYRMLRRSPAVWKKGTDGIAAADADMEPPWSSAGPLDAGGPGRPRAQSTPGPGVWRHRGAAAGARISSRAMPTLLFVTVPTDEVLGKDGNVRFPGTEAAVAALTEAGWTVETVAPDWPKPLERAKELTPDAALVSCFRAVPRARDSASMLARMSEVP